MPQCPKMASKATSQWTIKLAFYVNDHTFTLRTGRTRLEKLQTTHRAQNYHPYRHVHCSRELMGAHTEDMEAGTVADCSDNEMLQGRKPTVPNTNSTSSNDRAQYSRF